MNDQILQIIIKNAKHLFTCLVGLLKHFPPSASPFKVIIVFFVLLFIPANSFPQNREFFGVKTIIKDVKKRFKLNAAEVRSISPLISQENENVTTIYDRFGGDEPEYSPGLWSEIIRRRLDFESRLKDELTKRQKAALRTARTELEQRVLSLLIEDYTGFLADFLQLNSLEFEAIQILIHLESKRKYRFIIKDLSRPTFLQAELEKISNETDRWMEKILSPEQLRDYRSLSAPEETFVASLRY